MLDSGRTLVLKGVEVRRSLISLLAGSLAAAALAGGASSGSAGFRPITIRGVVLARDVRGTFFADRMGDVYQLFVNKKIGAGSRITVRGSWDGKSRFAIWATDPRSVTILGHAARVEALGQIVVVDSRRHRFQLGAHDQIIAWVSFRPALASSLRRLSFQIHRTFRIRLAFARGGRLVLEKLPNPYTP